MNGRTDRQTWIGKAHLALYLVSFVIPFHPSFVPFRWQWELRQISVTPYRLMENRNWQHTTATGDSSHSISGRASSHLLWYEHRDCTAGFMYVCGLAVILIQNLHFPYIVVVACVQYSMTGLDAEHGTRVIWMWGIVRVLFLQESEDEVVQLKVTELNEVLAHLFIWRTLCILLDCCMAEWMDLMDGRMSG